MLSAIESSLREAASVRDEMMDEMSDDLRPKADRRWETVQNYLQSHDAIQNAALCRLFSISPATANRMLRAWVQEGKLERYRKGRSWAYRVK